MSLHEGNKTRGAVVVGLALLSAGACAGPTLPEGAPDFIGVVVSATFPIPGGGTSNRLPEFIVQEEGQACALNFDSMDANVVIRRGDGTLEEGVGLDIQAGRTVTVWTRSGIVGSCPRRAVADVVEIQLP